MPIISLASSFRRYFGFFSPPKRFVLKWWSNLDDGQRPGQAEIFRSATLAGDGGIFGLQFRRGGNEHMGGWHHNDWSDILMEKKGKTGYGGWKLEFIGNQKLLLGWFCMQVQMINLAKKNVWLRMTRFPDDVCNVFCPFHLSQKASLKMNMTFLGTSCQNETLQKSFANRVVPVPSWERSHLPKQRALWVDDFPPGFQWQITG